jgi:hypothetical protein
MKMEEDKFIEKLVDHIMKDQKLESPSVDFTSKVMVQVTVAKSSNVTQYKPLISKSGLIGIICFIIALVTYSILNKTSQTSSLSQFFNFNFTNNFLGLFHFSKITTYSVVLATIMFLIQIPLLKNYFYNKF